MYQTVLLKSILETSPSLSVMNVINQKLTYIFPDAENKAFFNLLYKYKVRYDSIPSKSYLKSFFSTEKDNPAEKAYNDVLLSPEKPDNVEAIIDLQFLYTSKYRTTKMVQEFEDSIKTSNLSELYDNISDISQKINSVMRDMNSDNRIEITMYGEDVADKLKREYEKTKQMGYYVADYPFKEMTDVWGGIKKDDFINILSSTGQGKTTLMKWIAYHNIINNSKNVLYISMEMSAKSIESSFYSLHASNKKIFGYNTPNITAKKVNSAQLTDDEYSYYYNTVIPDFTTNPEYGTLKIIQPEIYGFTIDDVMADILNIHRSKMNIDLIFIDYLTLIDHGQGQKDHTRSVNNMIKNVRLFGLSNQIPIFNAVQANRNAYKEFIRTGDYDITGISDFNEFEKSSTKIISIGYTPEMRIGNQSVIQCIKDRDGTFFDKFKVQVNPSTGFMYDSDIELNNEEIIDIVSSIEI